MATHHQRFGGSKADPLVKIAGIVQTFRAYAGGDLRTEAIMLLPERQYIEQGVNKIVGELQWKSDRHFGGTRQRSIGPVPRDSGVQGNMNATKTTERKTRPYDLVLLAVVVLILVVVFFQGAWYMPPSGPVRGKARLLDEGSPSSSTLTLERGWDLTHLAERHYGRVSPTILDMVLEANPSIRDINKIPVNQKIIMPPLSEASFVLPAPDNRYTIHLGTFDHIPALGDFRDDYALKGKTVEIMVRKISPREKWYRLVAGPFATREEIRETLSSLQSRGISFEFSPQGGSRESAAKNGDGP